MGCTSSKLDDLPAVLLCRERCTFLDEAIRQRFAFAEAHLAYTHSLKQIGHSLHHFIDQATSNSGGGGVTLNLPPHKKVDQDEKITTREIKGGGGGHHSHSNSGSHLHFHSDSDDSGSISLHHSGHSSPLHNPDLQYENYENNYIKDSSSSPYPQSYPPSSGYPQSYPSPSSGYPQSYPPPSSGYPQSYPPPSSGYMQMNFMRNKTTPSVVYQQQPISPDTVHHINESSSLASTSSYYPYPNQYPYSNPYPDYGGGGGGGGLSMSNYYGSSSSSQPQPAQASTSKPAPAPPSPPRASAWDFLNPFESYDKYYPPYTPSRDSKEVREEEGIPDLEDEDYYYQHEVVKEVDSGNKKKHLKLEENDEVGHDKVNEGEGVAGAAMYQARQSGVSMENDGMEYEVHVVEKKVVDKDMGEENGNGAAAFKAGSRDVSDVASEIEDQFVRAAESGNEIATILEVGKLRYQRKHVSKMLHVVTPSLSMVSSQPSTSKSAEPSSSTDKAGPPHLDIIDEDLSTRMKNLSSTLHKLYLWEKKLYNEVKAEEKMRIIHDRKCVRLKRLDERGAESHKVDATRTLIRSLSTKIRIAINVVDKISVTINKIRDEELWPQLNELIQGLTRMWKSMLECHHSQCLAIKEARGLGPIGSGRKLSDAHLEATLQLEHELLNWTFRFSSWIGAQKGYVRALNGWLLKCLLDEPEETADGIAPFSPGRIGAPPVFVICNQWSQALERISEKEVIDSMRIFAMSVLQLWEHDKLAMRESMMANKVLDRKVRNLDREDQKIQKEFQALDKKLVVVSGDGNSLSVPGHIVYQSDTSNISLQASLQRIFEAMERFTADSMKAYEELLQRSEEERVAREHERVS